MAPSSRALPGVLVLGGLDPGGGAGLGADVRAVHGAGGFPFPVATVLTVQSTSGLREAWPISSGRVLAQAREVLRHQRVHGVKVGALGSVANVRAVARLLEGVAVPVVVDPVLVPTRGKARLLARQAVEVLLRHLVPRATVLTANTPEASALLGAPVRDLQEARGAARALVSRGAAAALVKGGHLPGRSAVDVLAVASKGTGPAKLVELRAPRLAVPPFHGGGCILASLLATRLAAGDDLVSAARWAKATHRDALARAIDVGGALRVLMPRPR